MTSAGGLLPAGAAAELPAALLLSGPAGRGAGRRGGGARQRASPTRSPSTWAARPPTCAWSWTARRRRRPSGRSAGSRSGCRRSTCTRSAPAAGRSPASTRAARWSSARESAGAEPGPACYGRGGTGRRSPTPTSSPAASRPTRRSPGSAPRPGRGRVAPLAARASTAEGVIAVVDAAMEQAPCGRCRSSGASTRGASPWSPSAAPGRCTPAPWPTRSGMPAVVVPARAGVLSAVGLLRRPAAATSSGRGRPRTTTTGWTTPSRRWAARPRDLVGDAADVDVELALDCRYAGQSHELTVPDVADFHAEHRRRNGYARPDDPVEVVALRAVAARPRRSPPTSCPTPRPAAPTRRRPGRDRRTGLHHLGARRLARRPGRGRRADPPPRGGGHGVTLDPAALQVLISRLTGVAEEMGAVLRRAAFSPNIKERADCSAALFTADGELLVQAEHIPVHLGSMPASVRAADRRASAARLGAGRPGGAQRPVRRRHAPQRHHAGGAVLRRRTGSSAGPPTGPTTPTSAGRRPGRSRPTPPRSTRRACASRRCCSTTRCAPLLLANSRTPDERAGDLDAQVGANVVGAERLAGRWRRGAARRGASTTASAGCAPRSAGLPDGTWTFTDVARLVRRRARPAAAGHDRGRRDDRRRRGHRSTSPAPTRSARATSTPSRR